MDPDYRVHITHPERAALWRWLIGTPQVWVRWPFPIAVDVPFEGRHWVYLTDASRMEPWQLQHLMEGMSAYLGVKREDVAGVMIEPGLAIRQEDCRVVEYKPQRWLIV